MTRRIGQPRKPAVLPVAALQGVRTEQRRPVPPQQVQKRRPQPVISMGMGLKLNP